MSLPREPDWYLIKMGNGADPEDFTLICGMQDVTINEGVNFDSRYVRDCAAPGATPVRKVKVSGKQLDISGAGLVNVDETVRLDAAIGRIKNYQVEGYGEDGTDAGMLLVTYEGAFLLSANNINTPREGAGSANLTLNNHGTYTKTVEPAE